MAQRQNQGAGRSSRRSGIAAIVGLSLLIAFARQAPALAANPAATGLKVPRFVSLQSDKVNLRSGPGRRYPIEWVLTRKDMPVEITAQFENWRRIRQWDGTTGWVQQHMVTGKRHVIVNKGADRPLYRQPEPASSVVARVAPGVVARLAECRGAWCRIEHANLSGWMRRTDIWGVYPDEAVP